MCKNFFYSETNDSRIDAKYFIGCDGAHSLVRRSLGIEFIGDKSNYKN